MRLLVSCPGQGDTGYTDPGFYIDGEGDLCHVQRVPPRQGIAEDTFSCVWFRTDNVFSNAFMGSRFASKLRPAPAFTLQYTP